MATTLSPGRIIACATSITAFIPEPVMAMRLSVRSMLQTRL